jgi:peptidoglycan/LPS O-acetylase OafA/YrhL
VNLFFIVSGYVIFMTLHRTREPMDFVVSRFSRLFPAYWAAVVLTFLVTTLLGLPGKQVAVAQALVNLLALRLL